MKLSGLREKLANNCFNARCETETVKIENVIEKIFEETKDYEQAQY